MDPTRAHFAVLSLFFFEVLINFLPILKRCYIWKYKTLLFIMGYECDFFFYLDQNTTPPMKKTV